MTAIIDIGSNSVILLIAKKYKSYWKTVYENSFTTRLIEKSGEKKTLSTLLKCIDICKKHNENNIHIIGTASFRNKKGVNFSNYIKKIFPFNIVALSSKDEAYFALLSAKSLLKKPLISIDIGGGSTDISILSQDKTLRFFSLEELGAVKLKNKFSLDRKPSERQIQALLLYIDEQISSISKIKANVVVSGGTATTVAAIDIGLKDYDSNKIHGHKIPTKKLNEIFYKLCSLKLNERKKIKGLPNNRTDIIIYGTAILVRLLEKLGSKSFLINHKGIRWGYLDYLFGKNSCSRLAPKSLKRKRN